jgi:8-oxo-dGTP pyrophosphatase MutT (NUDIX family)
MPHIHTEPGQHDHTVTAFIIRTDTPEPQCLVHMHRKLHILLPVGGHVELNETPWQAMVHELREESGYSVSDLEILQPTPRLTKLNNVKLHPYPLSLNTHDIPGDHFHSDIQYGFVAHGDPGEQAEEGESVDLRWLSRAQLNKLDDTMIHENIKQIYIFMFDHALKSWEAVSTKDFAL